MADQHYASGGKYGTGAISAKTLAYQEGTSRVDVLFATYSGISAVVALTSLPAIASRIGRSRPHVLALSCIAADCASFLVLREPQALLLSEVGIGIAWASILRS